MTENMPKNDGRRYYDPESPRDDVLIADGFTFNEKSIRAGFIRRVYSILSIQLIFTFGIVSLFAFHDGVRGFFHANSWAIFIPLIMSFVLICTVSCSESARRQSPTNVIILSAFTLCESLIVGYAASVYDPQSVFFAIALTSGIVLLLTAFAFQPWVDFTKFGPALFLILFVFVISSLGVSIAYGFQENSSRFYFACIGAVIFSLYIVYDTQMMMGGNHKYAISPEEYIYASLALYLDIINLFLYLLRIFGNRR